MKTAFQEKESELQEHVGKVLTVPSPLWLSDDNSGSKQMLRLTQELQDGGRSSTEEVARLLTAVASLTAERDQLKQDLQENVELVNEHVVPRLGAKHQAPKDTPSVRCCCHDSQKAVPRLFCR